MRPRDLFLSLAGLNRDLGFSAGDRAESVRTAACG